MPSSSVSAQLIAAESCATACVGAMISWCFIYSSSICTF